MRFDTVILLTVKFNITFQIEVLEEKQERGEPLDPDQQAKLLRKNDVLVQLEQVEAKKKATQW